MTNQQREWTKLQQERVEKVTRGLVAQMEPDERAQWTGGMVELVEHDEDYYLVTVGGKALCLIGIAWLYSPDEHPFAAIVPDDLSELDSQ